MTRDLALTAGSELTTVELERLAETIAAARAPSTRKAYEGAWKLWVRWATARGTPSFPADPLMVATYLSERAAAGLSPSTLTVAVAAIRAKHVDDGADDPTVNRGVQLTMAGIRRQAAGRPKRQAHPLTTEQIARLVETLDRASLLGMRDACLILVGFGAALRQSEVVALERGDLTWRSEGVILHIRRSKRDQDGHGAHVGIVRGHGDTDPVAALHSWVEAAGLGRNDPLFPRVRRGGHIDRVALKPTAVDLILKRVAVQAGLSDLPISGHSLRAGHATVAAGNGAPAEQLARTGRWADTRMLATYIRPASALQDSTSGLLGL